jgi:hypothetical protein
MGNIVRNTAARYGINRQCDKYNDRCSSTVERIHSDGLTVVRTTYAREAKRMLWQESQLRHKNHELRGQNAILVILLNVNIIKNELSFKRGDFPIDLPQEASHCSKLALLCGGAWQRCCHSGIISRLAIVPICMSTAVRCAP